MSPLAAKLLMCICAGSTGAAIVPAVEHVRALARPHAAVYRVVAHRPAASRMPVLQTALSLPMQASPCPTLAGASPGGDLGPSLAAAPGPPASPWPGTGGDGSGLVGFDRPPAFGLGGAGSTAFAVAPVGGPVIALPPGGGTIPNGGPTASSGAPEPAAWALMIGGFGLVGGAMRRQRALRLTQPQAQAISSSSISALGSPFQSSRLIRPAA